MPQDRINRILNFWFEGVNDDSAFDFGKMPYKKWFLKDEQLDETIRDSFEADLVNAANGKYKDWEQTLDGRLALIILFDQFSRNMFRDTERMYAYDALALELTLRTINEGKDKEMMLIHRAFLYLPLMHFEDISVQKLSLTHYEQLVEESKVRNPGNTHYFKGTLKYAKEHHDAIAEFGRFPYRDAILKRSG